VIGDPLVTFEGGLRNTSATVSGGTGGASDTLALAAVEESATLVALTVTVCALVIEAGAV
jgi:hypothetical protein